MTRDTETFSSKKKYSSYEDVEDDFPSMTMDLIKNINWRVAMFLFVIMIFVFSDTFIETFLIGFDGSVEGDCATTKGTTVQIILVVIAYIIIDIMVKNKIL